MSNCELMATCPFYNDTVPGMLNAEYREQYCGGGYALCGRYMSFLRLWRREQEAEKDTSELLEIKEGKVYATNVKISHMGD